MSKQSRGLVAFALLSAMCGGFWWASERPAKRPMPRYGLVQTTTECFNSSDPKVQASSHVAHCITGEFSR